MHQSLNENEEHIKLINNSLSVLQIWAADQKVKVNTVKEKKKLSTWKLCLFINIHYLTTHI
jgi:hypothetical protein